MNYGLYLNLIFILGANISRLYAVYEGQTRPRTSIFQLPSTSILKIDNYYPLLALMCEYLEILSISPYMHVPPSKHLFGNTRKSLINKCFLVTDNIVYHEQILC